MTGISRRTFTMGAAMSLAAPAIVRAAGDKPLRIGVLADMNGPYSNLSGVSAVTAVRLAVEDFHKEKPDIPVEVVQADFQLKPDIGLAVARNWFDAGDVHAIADIPMSALALGITELARDRNRVGLFTGTATEDLTGKFCGPNHVHWTYDSYGMASTVANAIMDKKLDTWFFIAADYAMGASVVRDASQIIEKRGGKVLGVVRHPFPGSGDFSSYLLQAQQSGAKVICFANAGDDLVNCIKQANEFNITGNGAILTAMLMDAPQVHSMGLKDAQGIYYANGFYWDRDDATRAFTQRLLPFVKDLRPAQNIAGAYSASLHYLRAAAAVGPEVARKNGAAVVAKMKELPVADPLFGPARIAPNGRLMNRMYLCHVRKPAESKGPWDYVTIAGVVPPEQAFRPLSEGACKQAG
ncbi:ABC transporter permease [Camelimonas fluminis]|uniref:ABC transporter substrate-binding protein n=1 Tax=Camelimonas fluminis TaxID=1576911 RepID=A0ABV7UPL5_9HYPH|nr:ABC transporter substrate-binding protein [Camelimonas fluminis]GHE65495.1 ABC transporter permease [Camelimonas fluminis]